MGYADAYMPQRPQGPPMQPPMRRPMMRAPKKPVAKPVRKKKTACSHCGGSVACKKCGYEME